MSSSKIVSLVKPQNVLQQKTYTTLKNNIQLHDRLVSLERLRRLLLKKKFKSQLSAVRYYFWEIN